MNELAILPQPKVGSGATLEICRTADDYLVATVGAWPDAFKGPRLAKLANSSSGQRGAAPCYPATSGRPHKACQRAEKPEVMRHVVLGCGTLDTRILVNCCMITTAQESYDFTNQAQATEF